MGRRSWRAFPSGSGQSQRNGRNWRSASFGPRSGLSTTPSAGREDNHERQWTQNGPRSIAIVGPFASGKTSLLEAILARTGAIEKPGAVANGTSVGDSSPEARAHSMSVELNIAETKFMDESFTFLDCPGSVEFNYESEPLVAGVDAAIVVAEPDEKKIPALQVVLRHLEERSIPRFLFLNKIDKASMGVRDALAMLQPASETPLVLRQIPIWKNEVATGFIDLALDRAFVYREHAQSELIELDPGEQSRRDEARFTMLERLADHDDALMEQLLEDIQPPRDKVFSDLAAELRAGQIVPVLIGSALNGNGIMRLLKALRHEAPNVEDTRKRLGVADATKTARAGHEDDPHEPRRQAVGGARARPAVSTTAWSFRPPRGDIGKVSGIFRMVGQKSTKRGAADAGETVGLGKVEQAQTGDTLGAKGAKLAQLPFPRRAAGGAPAGGQSERAQGRGEAFRRRCTRMVEEDPSLSVDHRQDTGETLLGGQGEMHLRVAVERLTSRFQLKLETQARARSLPRDDPRHRVEARPPQEAERRARPVRRRRARGEAAAARLGLRLRRHDHRRRRAEELHSGRRAGRARGAEERPARRLPASSMSA